MRAVAQAHVRTGLPITVHTCAVARTGLVAQEILRREGVDLATVVIGHSGDTDDQDYLHRSSTTVRTSAWTASVSTSCCRATGA